MLLARFVWHRYPHKPVDWLFADAERAQGRRIRALVPNLAEHVGRVFDACSMHIRCVFDAVRTRRA